MANLELQRGLSVPKRLGNLLERIRAPRIAELLLAALTAYLLALAAWAVFAPLPVPNGDKLAAISPATPDQQVTTARNPFPKVEFVAAPEAAGPDLEETALDLTLTGVWPEPEEASAIVRRPDGKERRFAVGEDIVPGVKLVAVYGDQIVIEQNGVRESLRFESKAPVGRRTEVAASSAPADESKKINNSGVLDGALGGRAFKLAPTRNSAGNAALAVFAGDDPALFEKAGLKDGDIIQSINGKSVSSAPGEVLAALGAAAQSGNVNLVVERDGRNQLVVLSVEGAGIR